MSEISSIAVVRARYAAHLTQEEAAQLVYVATATWSSWEQRRFPIPRAAFGQASSQSDDMHRYADRIKARAIPPMRQSVQTL